ncbi:hypothetical protein N7447_000702 [Penicillium robsamsonii]|uniref:uncharacterized protein n=1 Tax=Penicillium robsamsonii TaxID=1792511 RepID=UPI0025492227|nr:uncharacterized protein N7447_000702 [Penicillium robsamsonii]KAJ5834676.1 hypothetical protein N7447_000702 [Penicillium robsamsonii]
MPSPWPTLFNDESDTSSRLPEIFSNNASDSDSSTAPSVFDLSSESEYEALRESSLFSAVTSPHFSQSP